MRQMWMGVIGSSGGTETRLAQVLS
jgi:hypothetical protein